MLAPSPVAVVSSTKVAGGLFVASTVPDWEYTRSTASRFGPAGAGVTVNVTFPVVGAVYLNRSASGVAAGVTTPETLVVKGVGDAILLGWSSDLVTTPWLWMTARSSSRLFALVYSPLLNWTTGR